MRAVAIVFGLFSAFFLFYSVRLLMVTGFLQAVPEGMPRAYTAAIVFPVATVVFALGARWCWRRGHVVVT